MKISEPHENLYAEEFSAWAHVFEAWDNDVACDVPRFVPGEFGLSDAWLVIAPNFDPE
jgi:hypothetical protein